MRLASVIGENKQVNKNTNKKGASNKLVISALSLVERKFFMRYNGRNKSLSICYRITLKQVLRINETLYSFQEL